jgi:hypothetical protein
MATQSNKSDTKKRIIAQLENLTVEQLHEVLKLVEKTAKKYEKGQGKS